MKPNTDAARDKVLAYLTSNVGTIYVPKTTDDLTSLLARFGEYFAAEQTAELSAEVERLRAEAAIGLKECVQCGEPAFEISPLDPCDDGFCWNCKHRMTITGYPKQPPLDGKED